MVEKTKKQKAFEMRENGDSYGLISEKLGINKGTLSYWFSDKPFTPNAKTLSRINNACFKSAQTKHRKKMKRVKEAKKEARKEIGKLTKRDLFMIGIGLYLGDGTKGQEKVQISNSNPDIIRIATCWFRKICGTKTENLTPKINIYPDNDKEKTERFWSRLTNVPIKQFNKTHTDRRKKKEKKRRKLPHGTCHLRVRACKNKKLGVKLHRKIMGWIEAIIDQIS